MTLFAIPTVHLNGTSKQSLLDGYREALHALHEAERKMMAAAPHARDFYVQGGDAIRTAMEQHKARMVKLADVISDIEVIADGVLDQ